jgi:hypothetical protein
MGKRFCAADWSILADSSWSSGPLLLNKHSLGHPLLRKRVGKSCPELRPYPVGFERLTKHVAIRATGFEDPSTRSCE